MAMTISGIALVAGVSALVSMDQVSERTRGISAAMQDLWVIDHVTGRDLRFASSFSYSDSMLTVNRADGTVLTYSLSPVTATAFRSTGGMGDAIVASHVAGWSFSVLPFGGLGILVRETRGGGECDGRFIFPFALGAAG